MTVIVDWRGYALALSLIALCPVNSTSASAASAETTELAQAQPAPQATPAATPQAPAAPAPDGQPAPNEPIGNVGKLTGIATVIRNKDSIALKLRDDIYLNDVVQTSSDSSLSVTFNDATTFSLSANARITIDNYLYEDNGKQNSAIFDISKGTVAFVAAAVAKSGDMKITTPTATLGIRGTTGVVEVPEGAAATAANNVNIKLYPDADGRVGHIEVNDRTTGGRLGALTQAASGFAIRLGAGGVRLAAVPLRIPPQQIARDQSFVRQLHVAQSTGRQIVSEQREFRRANPGLNNRNPPPGQQPSRPGPSQRRNGAPGQINRPGQKPPGAPKRQDTQPERQGGALPSGAPRAGQNTLQPGGTPGPLLPHTGQNPAQPSTAPELPRTGQSRPLPGATSPAVQPQQGSVQHAPGAQQRLPVAQRPRHGDRRRRRRTNCVSGMALG